MAEALGSLFGLLLCLGLTGLLLLAPALWAWAMWIRVQEARRASRPRQPYDEGYHRACEAVAELKGSEDAYRDLRDLLS